jgi:hypothetical protein
MIVTLQKEIILWISVVVTNDVKAAMTVTSTALVSVREVPRVRAVRKVRRANAAAAENAVLPEQTA